MLTVDRMIAKKGKDRRNTLVNQGIPRLQEGERGTGRCNSYKIHRTSSWGRAGLGGGKRGGVVHGLKRKRSSHLGEHGGCMSKAAECVSF